LRSVPAPEIGYADVALRGAQRRRGNTRARSRARENAARDGAGNVARNRGGHGWRVRNRATPTAETQRHPDPEFQATLGYRASAGRQLDQLLAIARLTLDRQPT